MRGPNTNTVPTRVPDALRIALAPYSQGAPRKAPASGRLVAGGVG